MPPRSGNHFGHKISIVNLWHQPCGTCLPIQSMLISVNYFKQNQSIEWPVLVINNKSIVRLWHWRNDIHQVPWSLGVHRGSTMLHVQDVTHAWDLQTRMIKSVTERKRVNFKAVSMLWQHLMTMQEVIIDHTQIDNASTTLSAKLVNVARWHSAIQGIHYGSHVLLIFFQSWWCDLIKEWSVQK